MPVETPIFDELTITLIEEREFTPPACGWEEHSNTKYRFRHDDGDATFALMMPCGYTVNACQQFVNWLLMTEDARITCSKRSSERHDLTSIVVVPL